MLVGLSSANCFPSSAGVAFSRMSVMTISSTPVAERSAPSGRHVLQGIPLPWMGMQGREQRIAQRKLQSQIPSRSGVYFRYVAAPGSGASRPRQRGQDALDPRTSQGRKPGISQMERTPLVRHIHRQFDIILRMFRIEPLGEQEKKELEDRFGDELRWRRMDDLKASRIGLSHPCDRHDLESWSEMIDWMCRHFIRLDETFSAPLVRLSQQLKSGGDSRRI